MALFPDVQRKAQEEIDRVFGKAYFPTMADRSKLPYVDAVAKEALRWHTVANLGVPHRTDEDDVVDGFLIPKDAMLLPNIWCVASKISYFLLATLLISLAGLLTTTPRFTPSLGHSAQSDTSPLKGATWSLILLK
jgi:hypothetical protein